MEYKGRKKAIHTSQFLVPIWDLVPMDVWERYVYIEMCSWEGINTNDQWISFSAETLARKYVLGDDRLKVGTIKQYISRAIKRLEAKKVVEIKHGRFNTNMVWLVDVELCHKNKWYKKVTNLKRGLLYKKYEEDEDIS